MFVVCGEALYDLFAQGEGTEGRFGFDARPGGSPFNVATGMARQGAKVSLLAGLSTDAMGRRLEAVLTGSGVSPGYLVRTARRTTLSVVDTGPDGSPAYAFYGADSADCGLSEADLPPLGAKVCGLHFGSYSVAVRPVADAFAALAERERGRFISLDPNLRPTIEPDMTIWRARIEALRRMATLVKVSDEDLGLLYPGAAPLDVARTWAADGPGLVVVTRGGEEALAVRGGHLTRFRPPSVPVVDTVGAGDAFQATLLAGLAATGDPRGMLETLDDEGLTALLHRAAAAASLVCTRRGAEMPGTDEIDRFLAEAR